MPELIDNKQVFSLLEVTSSIQKTLADRYQSAYWVKAEMNKLNYYSRSGHCYPDLVEKKNGKLIAQIRANLWRSDYERINANFITTLKEPLKSGIKILFSATIGFHPQYGLSLRIIDIDPSFTLGDLEREKQETIERLQSEGIFHQNRQLKMSLLPQRIAIISVETSKGYADFLKVFEAAQASWGYTFFHMLFPSLLQGERAIAAMVEQLKKIRKVVSHFDTIAIIRGGGGDVGLSCYNHYDLAREIALFPIPVITGIGHATNLTVTEMVAFNSAITPTKLAEFLIQKFHNFSVPLQKAQQTIIERSRRLIMDKQNQFNAEVKLFRSATNAILSDNSNTIGQVVRSLFLHLRFKVDNEVQVIGHCLASLGREISAQFFSEKQKLKRHATELERNLEAVLKKESVTLTHLEKNIEILNPKNILKRGFSITLLNGKSVRSFREVKTDDTINTVLYEGVITSNVSSRKKEQNEK